MAAKHFSASVFSFLRDVVEFLHTGAKCFSAKAYIFPNLYQFNINMCIIAVGLISYTSDFFIIKIYKTFTL